MTAPNINIFLAELLVDELVRHGITTFCISPGSRSTPLTIAASAHPEVETHINIDERGSAYFAVGYARATGKAAAVICTSGTAGANMYPAVIEAYHSRLPLAILTADRPEELQDVGANQTINQENLFGRYVSESLTIPAPDNSFDPAALLHHLDKVFGKSSGMPFHLNCRFREPLAPIEEAYNYDRMKAQIDQWRKGHPPTGYHNRPKPPEDTIADIVSRINNSARGLIIAGPEASFRACKSLGKLSNQLNWPVVADIHSQQRNNSAGYILSHFDLYLDDQAIGNSLRPDMIIHVGGLPTSKRLNQFLLNCKVAEYIKIQDHDRTIDPDHLETECIIGQPDEIIEQILHKAESKDNSEYCSKWIDLERRCAEFLSNYFSQSGLTEPSLAHRLGKTLQEKQALYLSSSMPIRDADSFMSLVGKDVMVGANRGASGIDGVIASACGFATGCQRATTLLIGDLAFIHNLNSLAIAARSEVPVIIVVVNNNGGGIFHFLPVAQSDVDFEKYFATPHGLNFEKAAGLFDVPYYHPQTINEFDDSYVQAMKKGKSAIIEITGDREENNREHHNIISKLKDALVS